MTDPTVRDWREMFEKNSIAPAPGVARLQEFIANLESKHRYTYPTRNVAQDYTYPTDAGDVPAGTKFDHDINAPSHYTHLPVEAIDITEHFNFNMGNALKYIWRADYKGDPLKDLRKAAWYINREIARRERHGR